MHPDGQGCAERFHLSHVVRRVFWIQKELVDLSQHIWTQCTDEIPIRLQRSSVLEMASVVFFIQHILVAVERFLVELIKFIESQAPLSL